MIRACLVDLRLSPCMWEVLLSWEFQWIFLGGFTEYAVYTAQNSYQPEYQTGIHHNSAYVIPLSMTHKSKCNLLQSALKQTK